MKKTILFILIIFSIIGYSHGQSAVQQPNAKDRIQILSEQIRSKQDLAKLRQTIKKETWFSVETTSKENVEDAHAKAMKIINNPKSYSKKQLAVWENLTTQPTWKWFAWQEGTTYHLIMYVLPEDLQ